MSYSIAKLKDDLTGIGHGTTIDKVRNPDRMINRAAREILLDIDPQETIRIIPMDAPLYDRVYDYASPSDLKGVSIIDIRPQVARNPIDNPSQTYSRNFDIGKNNTTAPLFNIQFDSSVKTINYSSGLLQPSVLVNGAISLTDNGTWSGTNISSLENDSINYVYGNGSIKFSIDAASPATLECTGMSAVDLTRDYNQGAQFIYVYLSAPTTVTSIAYRWGSSNANYYSRSVTAQFDGTAFQTGWNLLKYDWDGATVTGAPDYTAIDYLAVVFTTDGTQQNNVRVNSFTSKLGSIYDIVYYSKFMFRDYITGAYKEEISSDEDLVNLDTETYNLLTNKCAVLMAQQMQGEDSSFDYSFFEKRYQEALDKYKMRYKSQIIKPKQAYYGDLKRNNYQRYFGRRT
jgi:hypothetical protein